MSYDYSNYTQFGIKDVTERYVYAGWMTFVITCSLLGDTTILVASIRYKAFRLHRTVVTFIQHNAICDLLNSVVSLLPVVISVFYNSGGSSSILNTARFFTMYYVNTASPAHIAAMTFGKLLLLKYPLRARSWSKRQAHRVSMGIWMFSLCVPTFHLLVDKDDVTFDYRVYFCMYKYSKSAWIILLPALSVILIFLPNVIITLSVALLLREGRKIVKEAQKNLRWQGIITVVLSAVVSVSSCLPMTIYFIAEPFVEKDPLVPGPFYIKFYRVAMTALTLNVLANFFVYCLTVESFKRFIQSKLRRRARILSHKLLCKGSPAEDETTIERMTVYETEF